MADVRSRVSSRIHDRSMIHRTRTSLGGAGWPSIACAGGKRFAPRSTRQQPPRRRSHGRCRCGDWTAAASQPGTPGTPGHGGQHAARRSPLAARPGSPVARARSAAIGPMAAPLRPDRRAPAPRPLTGCAASARRRWGSHDADCETCRRPSAGGFFPRWLCIAAACRPRPRHV